MNNIRKEVTFIIEKIKLRINIRSSKQVLYKENNLKSLLEDTLEGGQYILSRNGIVRKKKNVK